MTRIRFLAATALAVGALVCAANCTGRARECTSDEDCGAGAYCHLQTGFCFGRVTETEPDGGSSDGSSASDEDGGRDGGLDAGFDAGPQANEPVCSRDHLCWANPTPANYFFSSITGSGPNDLWVSSYALEDAVGVGRFYLRWDGTHWRAGENPFGYDISAYWAVSKTDVWGVGLFGRIIRWDGNTWSEFPSSTSAELYSIIGFGPNEIWAVGAEGTILRWNGTAWTQEPTPISTTLLRISGTSAENLRAIGDQGVALRRKSDGTWVSDPTGTTLRLFDICRTSDDVWWAAGASGVLLRDTGAGWSQFLNLTDDLLSLGCVSADDIWIGRRRGYFHWDGKEFAPVPDETGDPLDGEQGRITGFWASGAKDVWAVGNATIRHWDGTQWTSHIKDSFGGRTPTAIWAADPNDVFLGFDQDSLILRCNAQGVCATAFEVDGGPRVRSISGTNANDVWFSTPQGVYHWNGDNWYQDELRTSVAIVAAGTSDAGTSAVWYVGDLLEYCTGGGPCTAVDAGGATLSAAIANSDSLWAAGANGTVVRCSSVTLVCEHLDVPDAGNLSAIWRSPTGGLYVGGVGGLLASQVNQDWTLGVTNTTATITAISGSSDTNVWACGTSGVVLKQGGTPTLWNRLESVSPFDQTGMAVMSASDVWITAEGGAVLRFRP